MSVIKVIKDAPDNWHVWIGLEGDPPPPDGLSFIIGLGATRDQAVANAVTDLEDLIDRLQRPPDPEAT